MRYDATSGDEDERRVMRENSPMYADPMKLRSYTTDQLLEELVRRRNKSAEQRPKRYCDDCSHYVAWVDGKTPAAKMPDGYNACSKGHKMLFHAPQDYGDDFGFYMRTCADRDPA